jgi:hypothetical protein
MTNLGLVGFSKRTLLHRVVLLMFRGESVVSIPREELCSSRVQHSKRIS